MRGWETGENGGADASLRKSRHTGHLQEKGAHGDDGGGGRGRGVGPLGSGVSVCV